jgi:hypothetical protein
MGADTTAYDHQVEADLGIAISQDSFFQYITYPSINNPSQNRVYFRQPGYNWAWFYDYSDSSWQIYWNPGGGPAKEYFKPPS